MLEKHQNQKPLSRNAQKINMNENTKYGVYGTPVELSYCKPCPPKYWITPKGLFGYTLIHMDWGGLKGF